MGGNQIFIEDCYGQKVGSLAAFERGADLNEPVDHLRPEIGGNIMSLEWVINCGHR
jgi:hypothetical protein